MVASILKIGISRNADCDNMVAFPKSGQYSHPPFAGVGQI